MKSTRLIKRLLLALVAVTLVLILVWTWLPGWEEVAYPESPPGDAADLIARGSYLAKAGDCMACHTARGGAPYAGGREIKTTYGRFISPNITPNVETGLGAWSADDFWRALHYGKAKDGRFLYPIFPYPNYTKVSRADADALFAYLKTVRPEKQMNHLHELRFPYNLRGLLRVWQTLYFRPGVYTPEPSKSATWNRGAYLVQGLGHCGACHSARDTLGGTDPRVELGGGVIPLTGWYAPSLISGAEGGLVLAETKNTIAMLKTGVSSRHSVFGPMAEVVYESLQHFTEQDVEAMVEYLHSLGDKEGPIAPISIAPPTRYDDAALALGKRLYEKHCVDCHGANGRGFPPMYPPLAANRSLLMRNAVNPIRMVLNGGFPPGTTGNPRPYGMPPFAPSMSDDEVAAVVSYIRTTWGNQGGLVSPVEVNRYRATPVE